VLRALRWLRRWRTVTERRHVVDSAVPPPDVDPIEEFLRIVADHGAPDKPPRRCYAPASTRQANRSVSQNLGAWRAGSRSGANACLEAGRGGKTSLDEKSLTAYANPLQPC